MRINPVSPVGYDCGHKSHLKGRDQDLPLPDTLQLPNGPTTARQPRPPDRYGNLEPRLITDTQREALQAEGLRHRVRRPSGRIRRSTREPKPQRVTVGRAALPPAFSDDIAVDHDAAVVVPPCLGGNESHLLTGGKNNRFKGRARRI